MAEDRPVEAATESKTAEEAQTTASKPSSEENPRNPVVRILLVPLKLIVVICGILVGSPLLIVAALCGLAAVLGVIVAITVGLGAAAVYVVGFVVGAALLVLGVIFAVIALLIVGIGLAIIFVLLSGCVFAALDAVAGTSFVNKTIKDAKGKANEATLKVKAAIG